MGGLHQSPDPEVPLAAGRLSQQIGGPGTYLRHVTAPAILPAQDMGALVERLQARGYAVHAPVLRDGSLDIAEIASATDLPRGVVDEQKPGSHRLRSEGDLYFQYTVTAGGWKKLFMPPRLRLWTASAAGGGIDFKSDNPAGRPLALLGVRACDLAAIAIQDRVYLGGAHPDPEYRRRRAGALIVAVNCARSTETCFCVAMGSGPRARHGYDIALTELDQGGHRFLVEAATPAGEALLDGLPLSPAGGPDLTQAEQGVQAAADAQARTMPASIAETLRESLSSPRWQAIADRCLACGNCTMVCPTCFCTAVEDTTDLAGAAARDRRWDSCFSGAHSYIHGGSVRATTAARYRQWMTHKLSTWHEQFGTDGCTGCGRCITWCPVAIDITEEARLFSAAKEAR